MDFDDGLDVLARLLSGDGRDLPFRDVVHAIAAYIRTERDLPAGMSFEDWPRARYDRLRAVAPQGFMKCQSPRTSRAQTNPTDEWRDKIINDAVKRALAAFDEVLIAQSRARFDEELDEANMFFVLTNLDEAFLFQSYVAFRTATTTAKLMGPAGLVEQVLAYAARVNVSAILIEFRGVGWFDIYIDDLAEYDRLAAQFLTEARPKPIDPATIQWDPVRVSGGPRAGEDTVKTHVARAIVDGRLERIYVGADLFTDFSGGGPGSFPDHQAEALASVESLNAERQAEFDALVGAALGDLQDALSQAQGAWAERLP